MMHSEYFIDSNKFHDFSKKKLATVLLEIDPIGSLCVETSKSPEVLLVRFRKNFWVSRLLVFMRETSWYTFSALFSYSSEVTCPWI
jgi:hypothetical protein